MEILLQVIEEEVNLAFEELTLSEQYDDGGSGSGKGLGRIVDRSNTVGMFLSPISDIWNAVKYRAAEAGIKAVKTAAQLVGVTIAGLLPFNDPSAVEDINNKIEGWEDKALSGLDRQFATARKELDQGWETFKTDFWGIGFVASPMSAIAGLAVGGKALDTAFSVLNVASNGRAERVYDLISGERMRGDIFEANTPQAKTKFQDLPADKKKKVLDDLMKNPEVVKAVDAWSTTNLPKVMGSVVHDMNQAISSGQVGQVTPQEIQSYKAMAPDFVTNMFDKMKGKNKKFEVKPSPAALQAASKAVAAEIKSMPDVPAQPAQPVQQPQNPAQSVAQPQTVTTQTTRPVQQPKQ